MVITCFNTKGGTAKTSHATLLSYLYDLPILTNDVLNHIYTTEDLLGVKLFKLEASKKSLNPAIFKANTNLVCDLSSSMSIMDPKIPAILKKTNILIIPTLTDQNSIEATKVTINMVKEYVKNIHIVVSRVEKDKDFNHVKSELKYFNFPIHKVKKTTLFSRLAADGLELFNRVYHEDGEYQLAKSLTAIEGTFEKIIASELNKEGTSV